MCKEKIKNIVQSNKFKAKAALTLALVNAAPITPAFAISGFNANTAANNIVSFAIGILTFLGIFNGILGVINFLPAIKGGGNNPENDQKLEKGKGQLLAALVLLGIDGVFLKIFGFSLGNISFGF